MRRSEPKHEGVTGQSCCDFSLFDICIHRMRHEALIGQLGVIDRRKTAGFQVPTASLPHVMPSHQQSRLTDVSLITCLRWKLEFEI